MNDESMVVNETMDEKLAKLDSTAVADAENAVNVELEDDSVITQEYFEKTLVEMESMNFVEIKKINREFKYQVDSIEKAKDAIESILKTQEELEKSAEKEDLNTDIMKADTEMETGVSNMQNFLDSYDDTVTKLNALIQKSQDVIDTFNGVEKTTSYLDNCMIEILDRNLKRLEGKEDSQSKKAKAYYEAQKEVYVNRDDVSYIIEKINSLEIELRRVKMSIKKDKVGNVIKNIQKKSSDLYGGIFSKEQLKNVENFINEVTHDEENTFYMMYALSVVYGREKEKSTIGNHKWIEVFIMNTLDVMVDIYDLDGGEESWKDKISKVSNAVARLTSSKKNK